MKILKFFAIIILVLVGAYYSLTYISEIILIQNEIATKYSSSEEIDYQITFENMNYNDSDYWIFEMKFDTHNRELDEIISEDGIKVYFVDTIISNDYIVFEKNGSGHHISYNLSIMKDDINILEKDISVVTIVFDFDNDEVIEFFWNVKNYEWVSKK